MLHLCITGQPQCQINFPLIIHAYQNYLYPCRAVLLQSSGVSGNLVLSLDNKYNFVIMKAFKSWAAKLS